MSRWFPRWTRSWDVTIGGRRRRIDVEWDCAVTGGGRILVDGEVARRWLLGIKGFAVSRTVTIAGVPCVVRKGAGIFGPPKLDLFVDGAWVAPRE